ncbi:PREDICTED: probable cardiolipin synthase [Ceratosolen solmsi marchali]|uniref:cardiolipin synthase (CMP-forming) n=1 Tax=Ceratosolen solmsi marchali TaxID=326594 RepID=A0AAJ7DU13_9HYME|nr:PREDICTED: probable cardiolipin synthase [Ceratosolen solmsi marchali]
MSYFCQLQFTRYKILNRYIIKRCFHQCKSQCYCINKHDMYNKKTKIRWQQYSKRKEINARFFKEFQQKKQIVEEIIERENIWTIPNFLSLGRILATPCLSYLIVSQDYQLALWLFGFAGFSDLTDGWIARTWTSQASKLGSFLDPAADKLLISTMFLSLTWVGLIPQSLTCLVIIRDIFLVAAASNIRYRSLPAPKTLSRFFDITHATVQLAPTSISKFNTVVQLLLITGTLAAPVFDFLDHKYLQGFRYFTAITTIASGISYIVSKNTYTLLMKNNKMQMKSCKMK